MDSSLSYNQFEGAVYPLDLLGDANCGRFRKRSVKSLVHACAEYIVRDSSMTKQAIEIIPQELAICLMKEALLNNRDRAVEVLLTFWPTESISLKKMVPNMFTSLLPLHNKSYLADIVRQGLRHTTCVAHTFIESLKNRTPTKLKIVDMTGFPTAEVILYYLATHCMLAHNESRQSIMVGLYNENVRLMTEFSPAVPERLYEVDQTLPEEGFFVIKLDAFLASDQTHTELCKALKVSQFQESKLRLRLQKLDITCLGQGKINLLLKQVDPQYLNALRLKYNSLNCEDFRTLAPVILKFDNLTALDLSCNSISLYQSDQTCQVMADVFQSLNHLVRLDLSNNRIKTKLRRIISTMSQPLQYLRLVACGLTVTDIGYLGISHHTSALRELDLSENSLGQSVSNLERLLLAVRGTLLVLELEECVLFDEHIQSIEYSLTKLENLLYLNIAENTLSQAVLAGVTRSVARRPCLKVFRTSYSKECYQQDSDAEEESYKKLTLSALEEIIRLERNGNQLQGRQLSLASVELERVLEEQ